MIHPRQQKDLTIESAYRLIFSRRTHATTVLHILFCLSPIALEATLLHQ